MEILSVDDNTKRKVRDEYQKQENDIAEDLKFLKEWISKQPHLPQNQDDSRLERFLLRNKFRMEQTKKKLDNYYTLKGEHKEIFKYMDLSSEAMRINMKSFCWIPLKRLTHNYQRVFYCKLFSTNANDFELLPVMTRIFGTLEICLVNDYCVGDIILADGAGSSLSHLLKFDPSLLGKLVQVHQEAYSGRFGGAHIINAPQSIDLLLKVFRTVMPEKLYEKVKVHKTVDTLYEYIPKECLPSDLGGTDKPSKQLHEEWIAEMRKQANWLKTVADTTSNESLRIGKTPRSELFGTEGSFRKLNID